LTISDTTDHEMAVQIPTSHAQCLLLPIPAKNRTSEICVEMNKKSSINFISPHLWPQQPWPQSVCLQCLRCHAAPCLLDTI